MQAKLIFLNVLAGEPDRSRRFYSELFGTEIFARSLTDQARAYHMPISADGIDLNISSLFEGQPPRVIPFFAVEDRRATVDHLTEAGGKTVAEFPVDIPRDMFERFREKASTSLRRTDPEASIGDRLGDATLMLDPDGNPVGVMQLEPFVHEHFQWGKFRRPLTESQVEDHMTSILVAQDVFYTERAAGQKAR